LDNVIIIGAGPGGNNAALHLARNGCDVTVIDRKNQIGDKLCTGIVGAECLEKFPAHKSLIIREAKSAKFISPAGVEVDLSKDSAQAYILDRVSYVASFAEEAKEAGAVYLKGSVSSVKVQPSWVEIEVKDSQKTLTLKAEAVIISGGFGSKFTRQLGMGCVNDFATGAQSEVVAPDLDQVHIYFGHHIAPNFFAWLVPTSPNRALVGLLARRNAGAYLKTFISKLQADKKIPTSSMIVGSHPRTFLKRVLSLFLPRTPCGFERSCLFLIVLCAILDMRSIRSFMVTRRSVPRFSG